MVVLKSNNTNTEVWKMFYFLKEDFAALDEKINNLINDLRKLNLEGGEAAQQDLGIFSFEEYERQRNILSIRVRDLIRIKNQASIIEPQRDNKVSIGDIITFKNESSGEVQNIKIGSYMVLAQCRERAISVSYDAPLAKIFIGGKVNDIREGEINGKKNTFRILEIKE